MIALLILKIAVYGMLAIVLIRGAYCVYHYHKHTFNAKPADNAGHWIREQRIRERAKERVWEFMEYLRFNKEAK